MPEIDVSMVSQALSELRNSGKEEQGRLPARIAGSLIAPLLGIAAGSMVVGSLEPGGRTAVTWLLLALVALVCLARPRLGLSAGVVAAAGFDGLTLALRLGLHSGAGWSRTGLMMLLTDLMLIAVPLAAGQLAREVGSAFELMRKQQAQPSESPIQDPTTGAYRRSYLNRLLEEEVERGRRTKRSFTVCLVGLDDWRKTEEEIGAGEADQRLRRAIAAVGASKRLLDKLVDLGEGELLLVLAETPLGGAETVAWRLRSQFAEQFSASARVGIAEFPRDALTEAGLMEEVGQALAFARTANIPVVDRSLLSAEQAASPS